MTQDDRNRALIDCYRSGQMSEQQWQGHLREEPGLAEMWRATLAQLQAKAADRREPPP